MLESIERLAHRIGLGVSMGALEIADMLTTPELSEAAGRGEFQAGEGLQSNLRGQRPVAYLVDILPPDALSQDDLKFGSMGLCWTSFRRGGTPTLLKSFTDIHAVAAPADIAKMLEIQRGDVLLMFSAGCTATSGVVHFSLSYFLPGYFRFHVVRRWQQVMDEP